MNRGDYKKHVYKYKKDDKERMAGLVCWKHRGIVYGLSNETGTNLEDTCKRQSKDGLITIQQPRVISEYNRYMGGVDLADMRWLHCNSTIMGQHHWWLKLFFYLLDVGTSNSLVIFKLAKGHEVSNMSIVEYKEEIVKALLGPRLLEIPKSLVKHSPIKTEGRKRNRCAHCALFSRVRRTRFHCQAPDCQLPLCSVGVGWLVKTVSLSVMQLQTFKRQC